MSKVIRHDALAELSIKWPAEAGIGPELMVAR